MVGGDRDSEEGSQPFGKERSRCRELGEKMDPVREEETMIGGRKAPINVRGGGQGGKSRLPIKGDGEVGWARGGQGSFLGGGEEEGACMALGAEPC